MFLALFQGELYVHDLKFFLVGMGNVGSCFEREVLFRGEERVCLENVLGFVEIGRKDVRDSVFRWTSIGLHCSFSTW